MSSTPVSHKQTLGSYDKTRVCKMGNQSSKHRAPLQRLLSPNLEASFLVVSNIEAEVFDFSPEESYAVAYAINQQTSPKFSHRTLGDATVLDSLQVCTALMDKGAMPKEHVMLLTATKDEDLCVAEGMKRSFISQAKRVGKKGIFVCHFSGHGIKADNEWGVAPADFDYSDATYITGQVLNHWLLEAGCKATKVLFILDCCYSGGLAEEMTAKDPFDLRSGLYVLSACTAFETSLTIGTLRHSIFAYFLAYALRIVKFPPGKLPLHQVAEECSTLSTALSSLIISYSPTFGLKFGTMQPELKYLDLQNSVNSWVKQSLRQRSVGEASVCELDKHVFVLKYFREEDQDAHLCSLCLGWLASLGEENSPLVEFAKRGLLKDEVLLTALCCVMWSVASIHLEGGQKTVSDRNTFLLGFMHASATFEFYNAVEFTLKDLKSSLEFYQAVLEANGMNDDDIRALHKEISVDLKLEQQQNSLESIDPLQTLQPLQVQGKEAKEDGKEEEEVVFQSLASSWWVPLSH